MADSAAINTLNTHISDLTSQIAGLNNDITSLQGGALYSSQVAYMLAHHITDVNTQTGNPGFPGNQMIPTGAGVTVNPNGITQYNLINSQIASKQASLQSLTDQLHTATQQLTDLKNVENNTPANQQALATINATYMQATTKYYIIGAIVIVVLVIGAIIYFRIRKKKTAAPAAA